MYGCSALGEVRTSKVAESKAPKGTEPDTSPGKKDWISERLRELYSRYASEPLPPDMRELLDRLDEKTKPEGGDGK